MQFFDAKPISPFPSGSGKPRKLGVGTVWEEAQEKSDTFVRASVLSRASLAPGRLS